MQRGRPFRIGEEEPVEIRAAMASDRAQVAATLARAFADDPAMSYIFPDRSARMRRLPRLFALLFDSDAIGLRLMTREGDAATLWRPPGRAANGWGEMIRRAPALIGALGTSLPRALRVGDAVEAHFPDEPFWYLHIAGVDPARQGRGLGGATIRAGLARADADGVPAYLETATERNLGLYHAIGFAVTREWTVPGGPRFWSMRRPAGGLIPDA